MSEQGGALAGWMRSLDLGECQGQACWRTQDLLGGQSVITLTWTPEEVKAQRTIAMPGEQEQVQWHVHMVKLDGRWRCLVASEALGVQGWRRHIREDIRQMAVPAKPALQGGHAGTGTSETSPEAGRHRRAFSARA
jgi:hypothetical protein